MGGCHVGEGPTGQTHAAVERTVYLSPSCWERWDFTVDGLGAWGLALKLRRAALGFFIKRKFFRKHNWVKTKCINQVEASFKNIMKIQTQKTKQTRTEETESREND